MFHCSGTRSSNLLRHLQKGFLPAVCSLPVPGYMVRVLHNCLVICLSKMFISLVFMFFQFGKAIVCTDAAAEAARYGFTAVDRPEGFLILAVASLGKEITEVSSPPEVCPVWLVNLCFPKT